MSILILRIERYKYSQEIFLGPTVTFNYLLDLYIYVCAREREREYLISGDAISVISNRVR